MMENVVSEDVVLTDPLTLTCTRVAVGEYDLVYEAYQTLLFGSTYVNNAESDAAYALVEAADLAVREAFALDTSDRNSRQNAMLVGPRDPWLRRMLEKFGD
jgi:hypothetical protein